MQQGSGCYFSRFVLTKSIVYPGVAKKMEANTLKTAIESAGCNYYLT
jgi:hypothetical protein